MDFRSTARNDARSIGTPETEIPDTSPVVHGQPAQPAREISMRLAPAESAPVDIKLVDRGGSVRVAVRTPDLDLARNLQSGLGDLVHRLEHKGFETESWSPADNLHAAPSQRLQGSSNESAFERNSQDPRDGAQQGSGQQGNGRHRPKWVAELEQRLEEPDAE